MMILSKRVLPLRISRQDSNPIPMIIRIMFPSALTQLPSLLEMSQTPLINLNSRLCADSPHGTHKRTIQLPLVAIERNTIIALLLSQRIEREPPIAHTDPSSSLDANSGPLGRGHSAPGILRAAKAVETLAPGPPSGPGRAPRIRLLAGSKGFQHGERLAQQGPDEGEVGDPDRDRGLAHVPQHVDCAVDVLKVEDLCQDCGEDDEEAHAEDDDEDDFLLQGERGAEEEGQGDGEHEGVGGYVEAGLRYCVVLQCCALGWGRVGLVCCCADCNVCFASGCSIPRVGKGRLTIWWWHRPVAIEWAAGKEKGQLSAYVAEADVDG